MSDSDRWEAMEAAEMQDDRMHEARNIAMPGWDESCAMNCDMFREEDIEEKAPSGKVMHFRPGAEPVHS